LRGKKKSRAAGGLNVEQCRLVDLRGRFGVWVEGQLTARHRRLPSTRRRNVVSTVRVNVEWKPQGRNAAPGEKAAAASRGKVG